MRCRYEKSSGALWLCVAAATTLAACGSVEGTRAGAGLSAVSRGGVTAHGAAPGPGTESRPPEEARPVILPTPRAEVTPHHPEPLGETAEGEVYRTRVDVANPGTIPMRIPRVALDVELRSGDRRHGCEVVSVATGGPPVLMPGEAVAVDVRSVCPRVDGPHEVVSWVELPELTGQDALAAAGTRVRPAD